MPDSCIVYGCSGKAAVPFQRSVHMFPTDTATLNVWKRFVRRTRANWNGNLKFARICSDHFQRDCFSNWMPVSMRIYTKFSLKDKFQVPTIYPEGTCSTLASTKTRAKNLTPAPGPVTSCLTLDGHGSLSPVSCSATRPSTPTRSAVRKREVIQMLQSTEKKQAKTRARKPAEKRRMTRKAVVWSKRAALTTSQPSPPTLASDNTAPSPTTVYTSSPPPPPSTPPPGAASTPALPPVSLPPPADAEHLVTLPDVVFRQLFSNLQCKTCEGDISVTVKSHGSGSQVELQCPCRVLSTVAPPVPGVKMEVLEDDAKMEILEDNLKTEILNDYSTTFVDIGPY